MGELSKGSGISAIRGGDFELGASGVSAVASSDLVVEDITPLTLMPLVDDLGLVLGTGAATFTRSTTGTFADRNDGLVKTASIDVARFEQSGILIEGASTNLLLRSEEFDDAAWTTGTGYTVIADDTAAPDGAVTADAVIVDSGFNSFILGVTLQAITKAASAITYTLTADIKAKGLATSVRIAPFGANTGVGANVVVDLIDGDILSAPTTSGTFSNASVVVTGLENSYFRIALTFTTDTATTLTSRWFPFVGLSQLSGDDSSGLHIWGAKLEELSFASSYIKTTSATVTRALDDNSIGAANIPAPTADYSVFMTVDALGFDSSLSQVLFNVDSETSRRIQWNTTTGAIEATHGAVTSTSTSTFSAGDSVDICLTVDSTNQTLFINGVQEDQDAKGTVTGTATAIDIGHQGGASQAFSHITDYRIYDVALTAAQAAAL